MLHKEAYRSLASVSGDSRTPHYNVSPVGKQTRFAAYVCYGPAASATQEELIQKKQAFQSMCHLFRALIALALFLNMSLPTQLT